MISISRLCEKKWFIILGIICAVRPEYYANQLPIVDSILSNVSYIFFPFLIFLYYYGAGKGKIKTSPVVNLVLILHLSYLLSTALNHGNFYTIQRTTVYVVGFCIFTDLVSRHNPRGFIEAYYWIMLIYVTINFITIIKYPDGIWYSASLTGNLKYLTHWFFSTENNFIVYILPALCITVMRCYIVKKVSLLSIWMFIASALSILITFSGTCVVGLSVFAIYMVLMYKNKLLEWIHFPQYMLASLGTFLFIVIFRLQNVFAFIIENLLGRSLTLTGRTEAWDWAMYWIRVKPIFGSGYETNEVITSKLHDTAATHCHNMFLDITYRGGFVALMIFILILYFCGKAEKHYKYNSLTRIVTFSIFVFTGILFLTEAYFNQRTFFMLLTMLYQIGYIVKKCTESEVS